MSHSFNDASKVQNASVPESGENPPTWALPKPPIVVTDSHVLGIRPDKQAWDHDAVYKPFAILDKGRWLLWYNGRRGGVEQIGLVVHEGEDLGFDNK
jgi:hypothetical protein